ncbi:MAG: hypothetical protein HZC40_14465 [Chloroflexi bacterium]|nr:hypothetical protein [Chloroflexota bacterium]
MNADQIQNQPRPSRGRIKNFCALGALVLLLGYLAVGAWSLWRAASVFADPSPLAFVALAAAIITLFVPCNPARR